MMPAAKRYVTKIFSKEIGSARLSFAPPEAMEEMLSCPPGSASVMGLLFDRQKRVSLYFDRDVLRNAVAACVPEKALDVNMKAFDAAVALAADAAGAAGAAGAGA